jgi:GTP-binding protein HflX
MSDTVGFIRKLPHQLVDSFKSTLDEVREADILVHVLDISHPTFEDQFEVVNNTLKDIGALDKPTIVLFNKIDAYSFADHLDYEIHDETANATSMVELKRTWMAKMNEKKCVFISATNKENIEELKDVLYDEVKKIHVVRFPYNEFLY